MTCRLLIVTFDLPGARGGDPRYGYIDGALHRFGQMKRPIKQVRVLVTTARASTIRATVRRIGGPRANVLVACISRPWAIRIQAPRDRAAASSMFHRFAKA